MAGRRLNYKLTSLPPGDEFAYGWESAFKGLAGGTPGTYQVPGRIELNPVVRVGIVPGSGKMTVGVKPHVGRPDPIRGILWSPRIGRGGLS